MFSTTSNLVIVASFLIIIAHISLSHIRMLKPPNRASLWRDPRFKKFNPVVNKRDDYFYCLQTSEGPSAKCGACGKGITGSNPVPIEFGDRGIIAGNYTTGEVIPITLEATVPHNGSIHFQLCDEVPETENCFQNHPRLNITTNGGTFLDIPTTDTAPFWINGTLQLPQSVNCTSCVLRVNFVVPLIPENWGCKKDTAPNMCVNQATFWSCVDISIAANEEDAL